ncbi:unnamed protein product [Blepharisma stoltei]|uniref:Trimethylguanosine synthase n=1 Tax=Blepharisma stoltei TaxID=1481888 RepID=A0AAU9IHS7_9CILI|nr:unnamed protein product [Blepharisma stoltei]
MESTTKEKLLPIPKRSFFAKLCMCFCLSNKAHQSDDISMSPFDTFASSTCNDPDVYSIKNYSADKIYLLGAENKKILCIFKHMAIESLEDHRISGERPPEIEEENWRQRYRIFSKYDEGIKLDWDSWLVTPHEKIVKSIAKYAVLRGKPNSVIDALCGVGGFTIQFAKYCKVIAIDIDPVKIGFAQINAEVYGVSENIAFIEADFLEVAHGHRADLTIVSPDYLKCGESFDMNNFRPELPILISSALKCSQSVLIYLPPNVDVQQFANVIYEIDETQPFIEITLLFDGSHLKAASCLLGPIVKFPTKDVILAISSRLGLIREQKEYLKQIVEQVSIKTLMDLVNETERIAKDVKYKGKKFLELAMKIPDIKLEGIPVLFKGENYEPILQIFKERGDTIIEKEIEGDAILEIKGERIVGSKNIIEHLNSKKVDMKFITEDDINFG